MGKKNGGLAKFAHNLPILLAMGPEADMRFAEQGHTFLGIPSPAESGDGEEIHVWLKKGFTITQDVGE